MIEGNSDSRSPNKSQLQKGLQGLQGWCELFMQQLLELTSGA
jgi:hypothetical protein